MSDRPKLSLKANIVTDGQLVFDSPKVGNSEHGEYHLYCVKVDGTEYSWFASGQAHEIVQKLNLGKDSPIAILKDEYDDGKYHFLINGQSHDDLFSHELPPKNNPPQQANTLDEILTIVKNIRDWTDKQVPF